MGSGGTEKKEKGVKESEDLIPKTVLTKAEQWVTTLVIYYCHLSLGVSASFLAPALVSFAEAYSTGMQSLSLVLTVSRYLSLVSGLAFGYLFGHVNRHAIVVVLVFVISAVLFFLPYSGSLTVFGILFALMNIACMGYVTATSVWVLDIWNDKAGPYIQAQHFFYALGCIIPPVIFAPFLDRQGTTTAASGTASTNTTFIVETTAVDHMDGVYIPSLVCGAVVGLGGILMFVIFFVFKKPSNYAPARTEEAPTKEQNKSATDEASAKQHCETAQTEAPASSKQKKYLVIGLGSLLLGAVQSMELVVNSYLPAYSHYSHFNFTEAEGAKLFGAFQVTFTFTRLVGILVILKLDTKVILLVNVLMVAAGNILILIFSSSGASTYLWVGAVLMGIGFATCFPTIFAYLQNHLDINNMVGSILIIGGAALASFYPMIVGALIEKFADIVAWLNLGTDVAAAVLFSAIVLVVKGHKGKL